MGAGLLQLGGDKHTTDYTFEQSYSDTALANINTGGAAITIERLDAGVVSDSVDAIKSVSMDAADISESALSTAEVVATDSLERLSQANSDSLAMAEAVNADSLSLAELLNSDSLSLAETLNSDSLAMAEAVNVDSLAFAGDALWTVQEGQQGAFNLLSGIASSLFERSATSESNILDAAGQAISGANRTEDGKLTQTMIYAVAAVAGIALAVMAWKG